MSIRIATFNAENLFARYRFREGREALAPDGFTINDLAFSIYDEASKRLTAKAIKEVDADIICLQEVESLPVLEHFNSSYLGGMKYKHRILIDSHDPRFIDIAVLSRYPFSSLRTYRHERNKRNTAWLFSRDCLEVDINIDKKNLTLYANHFKSMMEGRDETKGKRMEQAQRVAEIVNERWKKAKYEGNFAILGDLNDYVDRDTSLTPLINHQGLVNVSERLPKGERWTHYWAGGNEYRQLDYMFLSKSLAELNRGEPEVMRKGLPYRAEKYSGERFDEVGENHPKASDHAPLFMDIGLA
jgi:predicted extracellular nuclease